MLERNRTLLVGAKHVVVGLEPNAVGLNHFVETCSSKGENWRELGRSGETWTAWEGFGENWRELGLQSKSLVGPTNVVGLNRFVESNFPLNGA